jgi:hypothetical protein
MYVKYFEAFLIKINIQIVSEVKRGRCESHLPPQIFSRKHNREAGLVPASLFFTSSLPPLNPLKETFLIPYGVLNLLRHCRQTPAIAVFMFNITARSFNSIEFGELLVKSRISVFYIKFIDSHNIQYV